MEITFVTGNAKKAEYLEKYLGFPVRHQKLELDEIQSLDLRVIVEHKVRQAHAHLQAPVLVEDVALEFEGLHGLPGPFIRFFVDAVPLETVCAMISGQSRRATARCVFGYYDGALLKTFEGSLDGTIAEKPTGSGGYGWDRIFIPTGYSTTRAELSEEDDRKTYTTIKPFAALKTFLEQRS